MANDTATSANVTYSKGRVGGMAFRAPLGTALPTDAASGLDAAFENVGYISDAGLKHSTGWSTNETKAWDGSTVKVSRSDKKEEFKFVMLEALRPVVQKTVRGDANVSGSVSSGMTITGNSAELEAHAWIFDSILDGGILKRTVVPNGEISAVEEVEESGKSSTAYGVTLLAMPDESGSTFYEHIGGGV